MQKPVLARAPPFQHHGSAAPPPSIACLLFAPTLARRRTRARPQLPGRLPRGRTDGARLLTCRCSPCDGRARSNGLDHVPRPGGCYCPRFWQRWVKCGTAGRGRRSLESHGASHRSPALKRIVRVQNRTHSGASRLTRVNKRRTIERGSMKVKRHAALALMGIVAVAASLRAPPRRSRRRRRYCHRTSSAKKPYVKISVTKSVLKGHIAHSGDIIPAPLQGCPAGLLTAKKGGKKLNGNADGRRRSPAPVTRTAPAPRCCGCASVRVRSATSLDGEQHHAACLRLRTSTVVPRALRVRWSSRLMTPDADGTVEGASRTDVHCRSRSSRTPPATT